jgi:hypothetical protein
VGTRELDRRPFSLSLQGYLLLIGRPVVKGRGVGINRVFLVTFVVTSAYSTFDFRTRDILGLVGPTGVVESSLEAPSSSADARACNQNWFWFWCLKFCLELVWLPGVWLTGSCPGTSRSRCGDWKGGVLRLAPVCMRVLFSVESRSWFICKCS